MDTHTCIVKVVGQVAGKQSIVCEWDGKATIRVRVIGGLPKIDEEITITFKHTKEDGCPKFATYRSNDNKTETAASEAASVEQWKEREPIVLRNGEHVLVKGSGTTYKVTRAKEGDGMYCSCPAWKYQRKNPAMRTCKHCEAVCGEKNEAIRVAQATLRLLSLSL
jgi:hypothetical protein